MFYHMNTVRLVVTMETEVAFHMQSRTSGPKKANNMKLCLYMCATFWNNTHSTNYFSLFRVMRDFGEVFLIQGPQHMISLPSKSSSRSFLWLFSRSFSRSQCSMYYGKSVPFYKLYKINGHIILSEQSAIYIDILL